MIEPNDPRVAAFLARGHRTTWALAPRIWFGMNVVATIAACVGLLAVRDARPHATLAALVLIAVHLIFFSRTLTVANARGVRRLIGVPRPWSKLEGVQRKVIEVTYKRQGGGTAGKQTIRKTQLTFEGGGSLTLSSEWQDEASGLATFAEIAGAVARPDKFPQVFANPNIERILDREAAPSLMPMLAGLGVMLAMLLGVIGINRYQLAEQEREWRRHQSERSAETRREVEALNEARERYKEDKSSGGSSSGRSNSGGSNSGSASTTRDDEAESPGLAGLDQRTLASLAEAWGYGVDSLSTQRDGLEVRAEFEVSRGAVVPLAVLHFGAVTPRHAGYELTLLMFDDHAIYFEADHDIDDLLAMFRAESDPDIMAREGRLVHSEVDTERPYEPKQGDFFDEYELIGYRNDRQIYLHVISWKRQLPGHSGALITRDGDDVLFLQVIDQRRQRDAERLLTRLRGD
jgi:hypothetical protein